MQKIDMRKITVILSTVIFFILHANAQTPGLGSWTIINIKIPVARNWVAMADAQTRSQKFYNEFYSYDYKAAVSYSFNSKINFQTGIGGVKNYQDDGNFKKPLQFSETRLWEQVALYYSLHRFKFENRIRAEQRFTSNGYFNRFRYRLNASLPLNRKIISDNTFYLNCFDEVFFTNTHPLFLANQFFAGAGYQFNKHLTVQSGWINLLNEIPGSNVSYKKNFVQISFLITTNGYGKQEHHSNTQD